MKLSNFRRKMGYLVTFAADIWGTQVSVFYLKHELIPYGAISRELCAYVD